MTTYIKLRDTSNYIITHNLHPDVTEYVQVLMKFHRAPLWVRISNNSVQKIQESCLALPLPPKRWNHSRDEIGISSSQIVGMPGGSCPQLSLRLFQDALLMKQHM